MRRYNRTAAIGGMVTDQLARMGIETRVRQHMAPRVWAELVGPQVASATEVEKVKDGVLYVCAKSATWASELTFYKADILRRLNEKLTGNARRAALEPVITDIRFLNRGARRKAGGANDAPARQPSAEELDDVDLSPSEIAAVDAGVAGIEDDALRERVRNARLANARLRTWRLDNGWGPCPTCGELSPPAPPYEGRVDCARCRIGWYLGR
jgi:predicted nucleic acid-binding Zn ribbon protein